MTDRFLSSRRNFLEKAGLGFGSLALTDLLSRQGVVAAPQNPLASAAPEFAPKAKAVIWLFQTGSPSQKRLSCTECHDPHAPAYEAFHPLPGPHTLRMSDGNPHKTAHSDQGHTTRRNPLRTWQNGPSNHADEQDHPHSHDEPESNR